MQSSGLAVDLSYDPQFLTKLNRILCQIADQITRLAGSLVGLSPEAYGQLVGSAASQTEPKTSQANRYFLETLAKAIFQLAQRIADSQNNYLAVEDGAVKLSKQLVSGLEASTPAVFDSRHGHTSGVAHAIR